MSTAPLRRLLAAAVAAAGVTVLLATSAASAQAVTQPNGSDGTYYLFDSGTETRAPAGHVYAFTDDLVGSQSSRDARMLFTCGSDATSVQNFVAPVGSERNRSAWSAYSDGGFFFGSKSVLEAPANLSTMLFGSADSVRSHGGTYSLGFACLKSNGVQLASSGIWYTTIHVTPGTGAYTVDVPTVLPALTTVKPTISGTTTVGSKLTVAHGSWAPATVALSYTWFRGDQPIAGATGSTYILTPADQYYSISVLVTGTRSGYESAQVYSDQTASVLSPFSSAPVPTISGQKIVGKVLTATINTWAPQPVNVTLQWKRAGVAIAGATASTYRLAAADLGTTITVTATGTEPGFVTTSKTSVATAAIATGTLSATPTPTIAGTAVVGTKLTATAGTWSPVPVTLTYQWKRAGVAITGATASTYTLVTADKGKTLTVSVTGTKAGYTTVTTTSAPTAATK